MIQPFAPPFDRLTYWEMVKNRGVIGSLCAMLDCKPDQIVGRVDYILKFLEHAEANAQAELSRCRDAVPKTLLLQPESPGPGSGQKA